MISYKQARKDFEYLEAICEVPDEVEIDAQRIILMRNPTQRKAAELYAALIRAWFVEG